MPRLSIGREPGLHWETGNKLGVAAALIGEAPVAVSTGEPERGARVLGAVEALLERAGAVLDRMERLLYKRAVDLARERPGEEAFPRAWQAGAL